MGEGSIVPSGHLSKLLAALVIGVTATACSAQGILTTAAPTKAAVSAPAADEQQEPTASAASQEAVRDVTVDDLATAISPNACGPSARMVDGKVHSDVPIAQVETDTTKQDAPVFLDMAGLGYRQALAVFDCGGANTIPSHLMLTGTGGELLGSLSLGDFEQAAHTNVMSMEPDGDSVTLTWAATQTAGSNPTMHRSSVSFSSGALHLTEIDTPNVLGVPLAQVIRPTTGQAAFVSPTGKLACELSTKEAHCEGMSLASAPQDNRSYCPGPVGGVDGPSVDVSRSGWHCSSQQTIFPETSQAWWQGHGFPTVNSKIGGSNSAVLPYGWVVEMGALACRSESDGITCASPITGNGFTGNDSQVTFTGPVA